MVKQCLQFIERSAQKTGVFVSFIAILISCSSNSKSNRQLTSIASGTMSVIQTIPADGEQNVPLNGTLHLVMSEPVDAFSNIPENFEIFDKNGNRFTGNKLVSSRYVLDPRDDSKVTSLISIQTRNKRLFPNTDYVLTWGQVKPNDSAGNQSVFGVQSLTGNRLTSGSITFKTGNCFLDFIENIQNSRSQNCISQEKNFLDVVSLSPGVELTQDNLGKFAEAIGDLVSLDFSSAYVTINPRTPIRIRFSEAFIDSRVNHSSVMDSNGRLRELERTPIDQFSHMKIFVMDIETLLGEFSIRALEVAADPSRASELFEPFIKLNGSVFSTDGRKTLVFELDPNETYPDAKGGQVIVFSTWGLVAHNTFRRLDNDLFIGGFVHMSDFEVQSPVAFDFSFFGFPGTRGASL